MEAIREGLGTLEELEKCFLVHRSLIIGTVVTLVQAGWVGIDSDEFGSSYAITDLGRNAINSTQELPGERRVEPCTAWIVVERCEGQVARSGEVLFWSRTELSESSSEIWTRGLKLKRSNISHTPEPALVRPFLSANTEEGNYIRAINSITVVRDGADFVPVMIDLEQRRLAGLPQQWETLLASEIFRQAEAFSAKKDHRSGMDDQAWFNKIVAPRIRPSSNVTLVEPSSTATKISSSFAELRPLKGSVKIINEALEHESYVAEVLRNASKFVVLSSNGLSGEYIEGTFCRLVVGALHRGVNIDVLWASQSDSKQLTSQNAGLNRLIDMQSASQGNSLKGRLMVAKAPTKLRTSIIVSDPKGVTEFALGGFPWLSPFPKYSSPTVICQDPDLCIDVCSHMASYLGFDENLRKSRNCNTLERLSMELDKALTSSFENSQHFAKLLHNREHFPWRDLMFKLDQEAEVSLTDFNLNQLEVLRTWSRTARISITVSKQDILNLRGNSHSGIAFQACDAAHANVLETSRVTSVSSFDWLAPRLAPSPEDAEHLGIAISTSSEF